LVEDSAVWDEIKITDDQLGKVTRLRAAVDKQARQSRDAIRAQIGQGTAGGAAMNSLGQPTDPEAARAARDAARQAERDARAASDAAIKEKTEDALKKILSKPSQFLRVKQIDIQEAGPVVVARPDIADELKLTSDQRQQIQAIIDKVSAEQTQLDTARRELFSNLGGGRGGRGGNNGQQETQADQQARRDQFQAAMEKARTDSQGLKDKTIAMIGKVLTKAQKTKFEALQGKRFDLTLLNDGNGPNNPFNPIRGQGGRGGPGGGGPGGGGPPNGNVAAATTPATTTPAQTKTATTTTTTTTKGTTTKGTTKGATTKGTATKSVTGR
jgi:hypothetical protein